MGETRQTDGSGERNAGRQDLFTMIATPERPADGSQEEDRTHASSAEVKVLMQFDASEQVMAANDRPAAGSQDPAPECEEGQGLLLNDLAGTAAQETPKQAKKDEDYSASSGRGLN